MRTIKSPSLLRGLSGIVFNQLKNISGHWNVAAPMIGFLCQIDRNVQVYFSLIWFVLKQGASWLTLYLLHLYHLLEAGLTPPQDFLFDEGYMSLPALVAGIRECIDLCSLVEARNSFEFLGELGRSKGREVGFDVCDMDVHFGAPCWFCWMKYFLISCLNYKGYPNYCQGVWVPIFSDLPISQKLVMEVA